MTVFETAPGERVYAIGDVHGCADLLDRLLRRIREDQARRTAARTTLVILGDIVDRGPDVKEVTERLRRYTLASDRLVVLRGNHEQVMFDAIEGDLRAAKMWLDIGGAETLRSFNVSTGLIREGATEALLREARRAIPLETVLWLGRLPLTYQSGSILFVHAGVRPGVPLADQEPNDLLWIRAPLQEADSAFAALVVHGHTINEDGPEFLEHRVGVDVGAYRTGRLAAVGFEGRQRWVVST